MFGLNSCSNFGYRLLQQERRGVSLKMSDFVFFYAGPLTVLTQIFTCLLSPFWFVKLSAMNFSSPHRHSGLRWLSDTVVLCRLTGNKWRWPPSKLISRKNPALGALSSNLQKHIGGVLCSHIVVLAVHWKCSSPAWTVSAIVWYFSVIQCSATRSDYEMIRLIRRICFSSYDRFSPPLVSEHRCFWLSWNVNFGWWHNWDWDLIPREWHTAWTKSVHTRVFIY